VGNHAPKVSMDLRRREEEAGRAEEAVARADSASDDDDDAGLNLEDLDDVDLVAMTPARHRGYNQSGGAGSGPGGGGGGGGQSGHLGPGLNLGGAGIGGGVGGHSSAAKPQPRVVGIGAVGQAGASATAHTMTRLDSMTHGGGAVAPPLEMSRGYAADRPVDGEADPMRDMPAVARGAAVLKRFAGPEVGRCRLNRCNSY